MTATSRNDRDLMDLLNAVWDDRMDEQSRAKIEELLARDPEASLEFLISYSRLHLDLEWLTSSDAAHEKALESLRFATSQSPSAERRPRWKALGLTGAAAAIFVTVFSVWNSIPIGHEHLTRTPQPVGRVVRLDNPAWGDEGVLEPGSAVLEGQTVDLQKGFAQLSMGFGADVVLQGPCRARILADDHVALERGRLGVRAARWAVGFRVETDDLVATDLGTWFSVRSEGGTAEVHVIEGAVMTDSVKADALQATGRRVSADEAVEMTGDGAIKPVRFRREVAADQLTQFAPLRPVRIFNTGIGLHVGDKDPHWTVTAGDERAGPYPQQAVVTSPHGSYGVNQRDHSQWISVDDGVSSGVPARSKYTFETQFDLTGLDVSSVWVSGQILADDGVDEVWLNGRQLDISPWKDWGYGVVYTNFHPISIRGGLVPGVNRLAFVVKNETFIYRSKKGFDLPETPNPMAFRAEWQAFGRPLETRKQN